MCVYTVHYTRCLRMECSSPSTYTWHILVISHMVDQNHSKYWAMLCSIAVYSSFILYFWWFSFDSFSLCSCTLEFYIIYTHTTDLFEIFWCLKIFFSLSLSLELKHDVGNSYIHHIGNTIEYYQLSTIVTAMNLR